MAQRSEVPVPGGRFAMGLNSEAERWLDRMGVLTEVTALRVKEALPAHEVDVDSFFIDANEVTVEQYNAYANGTDQLPFGRGAADFPALVNWESADGYCNWLGGRLPTEVEWERSARGADGRVFPWGSLDVSAVGWEDSLARYANLSKKPSSVGSLPNGLSPFGVADMAGNASEWVSDWFDRNSSSSPSESEKKTVKGVSVFPFAMSAWRQGTEMDQLASFRCARSVLE